MTVGKTVLALVSLSVFMLVSALYSAGLGAAKYLVLQMPGRCPAAQLHAFRRAGLVVTLASGCYALYSLRVFLGEKSMKFPMVAALAIACYTFVEFALHIRDAIRLRRRSDPVAEALKLINLSSTLTCFVLTQTAILSFADENAPAYANGLSGLFFGGLSALVGVYMMLRSAYLQKGDNHAQ